MRSTDAYSILSRELAAAALLPSNDLSQLADGPPFSRVIEISSEPVEIEIDVSWHGFGRTAVLISAHARGDVPPILSSTAIWSPIPNDKEIGREEAFYRRADHRLPA